MQAAECLDCRRQGFFGFGEVGDVDGEERTTQAFGERLAVGAFPVEDRHVSTAGGQQFRAGSAETGRTADDDDFLAGDLHVHPLRDAPNPYTGTVPPADCPPTAG